MVTNDRLGQGWSGSSVGCVVTRNISFCHFANRVEDDVSKLVRKTAHFPAPDSVGG